MLQSRLEVSCVLRARLSRSVGWCCVYFSPLGLQQVPHPLKTKYDKSKLEGQKKEGLLSWRVSG